MARSRRPTPSPADVLDDDAYAEHAHREMVGMGKKLAKVTRLEKKLASLEAREKNAKASVRAASSEKDVLINVKR